MLLAILASAIILPTRAILVKRQDVPPDIQIPPQISVKADPTEHVDKAAKRKSAAPPKHEEDPNDLVNEDGNLTIDDYRHYEDIVDGSVDGSFKLTSLEKRGHKATSDNGEVNDFD
eukprot:NODE_101_length_20473_cov_0.516590.p12 type:complete len:116 gc:universal NODE_101_length_20473_cov_0.516590:4665-5012(+)